MVFDIDPNGTYRATVTACDSVHDIARYELTVDPGEESVEPILKDKVKFDCSEGYPQQGPTKKLKLRGAFVPTTI